MTTDDTDSPTAHRSHTTATRRRLLAVSGGVGLTVLAGCTGGSNDTENGSDGDSTTDADDSTERTASTSEPSGETGTFRLLVSDQPVAIDDFDSLEVAFERARVFRGSREDTAGTADAAEDADATESTETTTEPETETTDTTATAATTATPTATEAEEGATTEDDAAASSADEETDESETEESRGFTTIDLDGATVDLTRLVGEKASSVFTGNLEAGRYTKIELYAADVVGIVEGEQVDVKIPSGKLMLTKPFTIEAGQEVSFVFDINVVKKGSNGYNLLPVISESGVAGEDVEVEEVDSAETAGTSTETNGTNGTTSAAEESDAPGNASASGNSGQGQS